MLFVLSRAERVTTQNVIGDVKEQSCKPRGCAKLNTPEQRRDNFYTD
jgi:hypothetical protein